MFGMNSPSHNMTGSQKEPDAIVLHDLHYSLGLGPLTWLALHPQAHVVTGRNFRPPNRPLQYPAAVVAVGMPSSLYPRLVDMLLMLWKGMIHLI
jgi:hypothetical protein